jgi:ribosomal protein L12E/L44/L45/RPP1/RPP2
MHRAHLTPYPATWVTQTVAELACLLRRIEKGHPAVDNIPLVYGGRFTAGKREEENIRWLRAAQYLATQVDPSAQGPAQGESFYGYGTIVGSSYRPGASFDLETCSVYLYHYHRPGYNRDARERLRLRTTRLWKLHGYTIEDFVDTARHGFATASEEETAAPARQSSPPNGAGNETEEEEEHEQDDDSEESTDDFEEEEQGDGDDFDKESTESDIDVIEQRSSSGDETDSEASWYYPQSWYSTAQSEEEEQDDGDDFGDEADSADNEATAASVEDDPGGWEHCCIC